MVNVVRIAFQNARHFGRHHFKAFFLVRLQIFPIAATFHNVFQHLGAGELVEHRTVDWATFEQNRVIGEFGPIRELGTR